MSRTGSKMVRAKPEDGDRSMMDEYDGSDSDMRTGRTGKSSHEKKKLQKRIGTKRDR